MYISKIKIQNFRRFKNLSIRFNRGRNILVGDNESGKSSVLQAIDLCARGSRHRVEDIGIETLLNVDAVRTFMEGDRSIYNLPKLYIELYLDDIVDEGLEGNENSDNTYTNGVRLLIEPDLALSHQTSQVLQVNNASFPFLGFPKYSSVKYVTVTPLFANILNILADASSLSVAIAFAK